MTEKEAISYLEIEKISAEETSVGKIKIQMCEEAIKALREVQEYREIGTAEECREAVEKQKPKSPDYEGDGYADGEMVYDTWICPNCRGRYEVDYDDYDYCQKCGQKLDWEG